MARPRLPNILVITGDDIGITNLSAYRRGWMGYATANIDRLASEGALFSDGYGEPRCTAGRAAFLTGQLPVRRGLTGIGAPGARLGLRPQDPTIAQLLAPLGYATGQFGTSPLGDRNEFLPTASERDDPCADPRFGRVGRQSIEDTGPLTRERMKTVDEEFIEAASDFIRRQRDTGRPFFVGFNSARTRACTQLQQEDTGISRPSSHAVAMLEHDGRVGQLLELLGKLCIARDTIAIYSADRGPHFDAWIHGATTPFRSEKDRHWEGAIRVPCLVRWPARVAAGRVLNGLAANQDRLPTLLAAAGVPDVVEHLREGYGAGGKAFRVHLDGFNLLPWLCGEPPDCPRTAFVCFSGDGELVRRRIGEWKLALREQRRHDLDVGSEPFTKPRLFQLFNLRRDPYERADSDCSGDPREWMRHGYFVYAANEYTEELIRSFQVFPPRERPRSFELEPVVRDLQEQQQELTT